MNVILFDIDGTLIASGGAGKAALEVALGQEFDIRGPIEKLPLSGRTDRAILDDLFRMHGLPDTEVNRTRLLRAYLRHLPAQLAGSTGRVLPGVLALLERLSGRGDVVLGLLTGNVREGARIKLGHYGLFEYFTLGGYGDQHLDRDDVAREALAEVVSRLHAPDLGRVWVIGDTPLDVRCARAIGARAVAVCTGWHSSEELARHGPDLLLTDLNDSALLLAQLGERVL